MRSEHVLLDDLLHVDLKKLLDLVDVALCVELFKRGRRDSVFCQPCARSSPRLSSTRSSTEREAHLHRPKIAHEVADDLTWTVVGDLASPSRHGPISSCPFESLSFLPYSLERGGRRVSSARRVGWSVFCCRSEVSCLAPSGDSGKDEPSRSRTSRLATSEVGSTFRAADRSWKMASWRASVCV